MAPPVLSVLVVSYNTRAMTLEALRSVRAETRTPHEIVVVDNASTDGSAAAIARAFPDVRLLAERENHGFARATNLAAAEARGEYLLLLNPDTVVLDGAVDRLLAFARAAPQARIWGGRTLHADGALNPTNAWARMSLWSLACQAAGLSALFPRSRLFSPEGYGGWARDSEREVDIVTGCFLLIERALWQRLGGFDPSFVMYGEEADLCLRARALGARPRITPEARIVHHVGAASAMEADRQVMLLKAKTTLIRRHFAPRSRPLALALLHARPWTRLAASGVAARLAGRGRGAHARWRAIWARRADWRRGYPDRPGASG